MSSAFVVPKKMWSLACCLWLLVAIGSTPCADASTATISKTVAVPLPELKKEQTTQYVVSTYSNCSDSRNPDDEAAPAAVPQPPAPAATPWPKAVYQWYLDSCTRRPFVAKGCTSATIAALGDVIAQNIETSSAFSVRRVATFFFCNLLFTGPFIHLWYTFLNAVGGKMEAKLRSTKLQQTIGQVFLDQTLGTFVFFPLYIYVYDAFDSVIRLHQLPQLARATEKCRKHLWGIILTQYRVFPISNMINFGLVPYEMRVLFTSTVSLFWNIYLCSVVG